MTAPVAPAPAAPAPPPGPKMVTLTIEGRTAVVPEGTSILEAAKTVGVLVPHYCYHPGLPVAGVCRMCLVEVEKFPKLAPSCATTVGEGQVVHVHSEKALEARKGVLEFLLINHPLDCPVCDQAGECELQDYTFAEGRAESRYLEPKRFNPVEDFGGDVLYVQNRCILCTRCVRFMDSVAKEPVLNVSERGDRAGIGIHPDAGLTHAWASNVVDLCPVGALLSKDFLNKARAWELDRTASVCPGCSQGCNMVVETRSGTVARFRPRSNEAVNQFYLCDEGRLDYRWLERRDRLEAPMVRTGAGRDGLKAASWDDAVRAAGSALGDGRIVAFVSGRASNEALFAVRQIIDRGAADSVGVFRVPVGGEDALPGVPDLSLRAERIPNGTGARVLGYREIDDLGDVLRDGDTLLILDESLEGVDVAVLARAARTIVVGTTLPDVVRGAVDVALPIATFAEEDGTWTNLRGRVQRFLQAKQAPGLARSSWSVCGDLAAARGAGQGYFTAAEAFDALAASHAAFGEMDYDLLGLRGAVIAGDVPLSFTTLGAGRALNAAVAS
jgi:NADH-quinone oxidoreductase subunit G